MKQIGIIIRVLIIVLVLSHEVYAGGTNKTSLFGAKSAALNALYFAGSDGLSTLYLNPAGLVYNHDRSFTLTGFSRTEEQIFDGVERGLYKSLYDDDLNIGAGINWPISSELNLALAFESVVDFRAAWPYVLFQKTGNSSVTIASDTYNGIYYQNITPAISYKTGDLALGLAVNVVNIKHKMAFAQSNPDYANSVGLPAYQFDFTQTGWTFNFNFGLMYELSSDLRLGLSVINGTKASIEGDARTKLYEVTDSTSNISSIKSDFQTPWQIGVGGFYKINEYLKLNVDFRFNLYSGLNDKIEFNYSNSTWQSKAAEKDTITGFSAASLLQKFKNSFDAGLGIEYAAASNLDLYFGYRFSSSPNLDETYNLLMPTVSIHAFSAGFGYFDDEMTIEGSVVYCKGIEKSITSSPYSVHNGKYKSSGVIPTLTFKWKI
jgi:long-subunit fatty acid transport protein